MASTKIKYLDTNRNEVVKEASVVAAFNDSIVLEFGEVEGENKVVQVIYDKESGTYQAVPEGSEKGTKWYKSKDKMVKVLKDQLPIEEYKDVPEVINVTIVREDGKVGHPIALREANYLAIKGNYEKALAKLRAPKAEEVVAEIPKEETIVQEIPGIEPMPEVASVVKEPPIVDNQVGSTNNVPVMEDIKNEPIDINNIVYTEMPVQEEMKMQENVAPVIEDVSKGEAIPAPVVNGPVIAEAPIMNEGPSKIMEAIQVPEDGNTISKVDNMPPIVDAPKQDNIVNFPGVTPENVIVNNGVQQQPIAKESKGENSAVEASYMDSFDKAIAQMKEATEKMTSAYEMMKSAMLLVTDTSENVKNVSHANFQEIQGMNEISRQTFENAQRMMASQNNIEDNIEEQSLKRAA